MKALAHVGFVAAILATSSAPPAVGSAQSGSEFWEAVQIPEAPRARELLQQARMQLRLSVEFTFSGPVERRVRVENAMRRLEMARAILPEDPEVLFWLAYATTRWERTNIQGGIERRDERARELWVELRGLDAEFESEAVAFELGVLYTRAQNFSGATEEYGIAAQLSLSPRTAATTYANLAEVTMLSGRIEDAVEIYEDAVLRAQRAEDSGALALWGLAVALDRLGERSESLRRAAQALSAGGGTTAPLEQEGVFFEPANEVHWYFALASLAKAEESTADERRAHLREARRRFNQFVSESRNDSHGWVQVARDHVARIDALVPP